jgi:hypothetical protein
VDCLATCSETEVEIAFQAGVRAGRIEGLPAGAAARAEQGRPWHPAIVRWTAWQGLTMLGTIKNRFWSK